MKWWFTVCSHGLGKYSSRLAYQLVLVRFKIKSIECHLAIKKIYFLSKTHFPAVAVCLRTISSSHFSRPDVSERRVPLQTRASRCSCRRAVLCCAMPYGPVANPASAASPVGLWARQGCWLPAGGEGYCLAAVSAAVPPPLLGLGSGTHLVSCFLVLLTAPGMERGAVQQKSSCCFQSTCEVPACFAVGFGKGFVKGMNWSIASWRQLLYTPDLVVFGCRRRTFFLLMLLTFSLFWIWLNQTRLHAQLYWSRQWFLWNCE